MRRRTIIAALAGAPVTWAFGVNAQLPAGKVARLGLLAAAPPRPVFQPVWDAMYEGFRENGLIVGQNIAIETRYTLGVAERYDEFSREFVEARVDLILAPTTESALAARRATWTIPIVTTFVGDPVGSGLAQSLARPGGNVTGTTSQGVDFATKQLQILTEVVPGSHRIAVLMNPDNPAHAGGFRLIAPAAAERGFAVAQFKRHSVDELEAVFAAMSAQAIECVIVFEDALTQAHSRKFVELAARYKLPAMYQGPPIIAAGGLVAFGPDLAALNRRTGFYVARILAGANPAELPIEQPTKFTLAVNLRTARALSLVLSATLLARADEVIE